MSDSAPVEVRIMAADQRDNGNIPTYRGWICPTCSAVVADMEHHARALAHS